MDRNRSRIKKKNNHGDTEDTEKRQFLVMTKAIASQALLKIRMKKLCALRVSVVQFLPRERLPWVIGDCDCRR